MVPALSMVCQGGWAGACTGRLVGLAGQRGLLLLLKTMIDCDMIT